MEENKDINIALLIDVDNISSKYIGSIISELSKYGKITIRHMYGDWTQERLRPWMRCSAPYSLTPVMQPNNTPGKNSSDIGLIIDAMDILYGGAVQGFCIVSSDGDFNKLATRLREAGKVVIGMGETKTPESFRQSCERFVFLDVIQSQDSDEEDEPVVSAPKKEKKKAAAKKEKAAKGAKGKKAAKAAGTAAGSTGTGAAGTGNTATGSTASAASLSSSPFTAAREARIASSPAAYVAEPSPVYNVGSQHSGTFMGFMPASMTDAGERDSGSAAEANAYGSRNGGHMADSNVSDYQGGGHMTDANVSDYQGGGHVADANVSGSRNGSISAEAGDDSDDENDFAETNDNTGDDVDFSDTRDSNEYNEEASDTGNFSGYEDDSDDSETGDSQGSFTDRKTIENAIVKMITDNAADGKETGLGEIGSRLVKIYPDFDIRNYHYSKLSEFLKDLPSLQVTNRDNSVWISLKSTSDSEIEQQILAIFARHNTDDMNIGQLKQELQELNPNLDATIRKSGVTRFSVYLNRNIHSVEVNGRHVTLVKK